MMTLIKKITACLPLLTILLISLGLMYLFFYYYYVGIIILPYLQPSEIALSSIHIIPYVIISTAALIIIYEIQIPFEVFINKLTEKITNRYLKFMFWLLSWLPLGLLSFTPIILTAIPKRNVLLIVSLIIVLTALLYILVKNKFALLQEEFARLSITFSIVSVIMTGSFAHHESKERVNSKYNKFKIVTKDSTFVESEDHIYYGKTNGYTIIYCKADSSSLIIPNTTILIEKIRINL